MSTERLCLYCGKPTGKVRKGDHLIPAAIGGTRATRDVCNKCNNELSDIDRELCSRSPLSLVASHVIDGHIASAWDVDAFDHNLLQEGKPDFAKGGFRIFPQLIVSSNFDSLRGDWYELREFGTEKFNLLFRRRLRKAFWEHEHGNKNAIRFSKVPFNADLLTRYTYLPRFFVRGTVEEACSSKTIELGYTSQATKRMALARVENGLTSSGKTELSIRNASALPAFRCICDGSKVWRGLAKIAVNLLHDHCERTEVNLTTFPHVIAEIRGKLKFEPLRIQQSGFIRHSDVATFAESDGSHAVRFIWERGRWWAAFAFFGGRIGAMVNFPGPNQESWSVLYVKAPLYSNDWTNLKSSIPVFARYHVEWSDLNRMISTGGFINIKSEVFEAEAN